MVEFKGVAEKFSVELVSDEGYGSERVRCEVGLEGVVISTPDGYRTLRKYALNHISRWVLRGSSLVLYTKTGSDIEEHCLTLQGDSRTIQSLLDTLTCSCMQMAELLQSKEQNSRNTEVVNSLNQLLRPETKKPQLKAMEDVEYWRDPEKTGWMHCQGEVIKSWRRRWFILKDGFLFRFASTDVTSSTKPRGFVDLSKVTDVAEARDSTNKNNSLKLSTETGQVFYVVDSETELVEWISALEGAVSTIVRKVAGLEAEPAPAPVHRSTGGTSDWTRQLEKVYSSAGDNRSRTTNYGADNHGSSHGGYGERRASDFERKSSRDRDQMVRVVGYDGPSRQTSYGGGQSGNDYRSSYRQSDLGGHSGLKASDISGIAGVAQNSGPFSDSFSRSQEYPAYPVLAPSSSANYGQTASAPLDYNHQHNSGQYNAYAANPGNTAPQQDYRTNGNYGASYPPAPAPQERNTWQVHYTAEGRAYYHDPATGVTQWEVPPGMA